tara:strand:- start:710 stop:1102 length:393 start_codon:yes stop_codon:yes gene_type:complete
MKKRKEDDQGKFPDLSGDGKVTMKDILMGRGVIEKAEGGDLKDPRYGQLMEMLSDAKKAGDEDKVREIESDLAKEFGVGMMGGGSIDEKMKYGGGGDIMIKTVEISMKVPEKQKRGTGAAMSGTKFSGTY